MRSRSLSLSVALLLGLVCSGCDNADRSFSEGRGLSGADPEETVWQILGEATPGRGAGASGVSIKTMQIQGLCHTPPQRTIVSPKVGAELATCLLDITFPHGKIPGTGFFVTPRLLLTAGHCVYDRGSGEWATSIRVLPGGTGQTSQLAEKVFTVRGWANSAGSGGDDYDYGGILLPDDSLYQTINFHFSLAVLDDADIMANELQLRGYPDSEDLAQCLSSHPLHPVQQSPLRVWYKLDVTSGQSGSPVFLANSNHEAIAVHGTTGCPNSGVRITTARREKILKEWNAE